MSVNEMENKNMEISYKTFKKIHGIFRILEQLTSYREISVLTTCEYRKHEYIFGVTIEFNEHNKKYSNYTNICFNDSDDNIINSGDIDEFFCSIREIIADIDKFKKLNIDFTDIAVLDE